MKNIFAAIAVLFLSQLTFAQAWTGKGDQKVQAGVNAWGFGTGISGTYDYGLGELISVGGGAKFYFDNYRDNDDRNRAFLFGRINAHLQETLDLPERWDVYPGLHIGVVGRDFGLEAHIGARYFFTDKIGAFVELGSHGTAGVAINF